MNEHRKHIVDELSELGSDNLAKIQPSKTAFSSEDLSDLQNALDRDLGSTEKEAKRVSLKWFSYAAIAATLVLGVFLGAQHLNKDLDWQEIDSVAILEYMEEEENNLSEDEIIGLYSAVNTTFAMEEVNTEALEDYILDYYINDLNEEDLL